MSKKSVLALLATLVACFSASTLACEHHETQMDQALHKMSDVLGNFLVTQDEWGMDRSRIQAGCNYQNDEQKTVIVIRSTDNPSHRGKNGMKAIEAADFARPENFCTAGANFYIDDEGYVFACRELSKMPAVSVPNTGVIGITVMGHFGEGAEVTPAMKTSLEGVIKSLRFAYGPLPIVPLSRRNEAAAKAFPNNPGPAMLKVMHEDL